MKVRYSPIISQASGSAGPVVASRWKGINYLRERITPANPKSAGQTTQRGYMTQAVAWWHDLESQVQDAIDTLVEGLALSAFNAWVKRNVKDLADGVDPRFMPLNTTVNPLTSAAHTPGGASGSFNLSWVQGEAAGTDHAYIVGGVSNVGGDLPANLFLQEKDTTLISAGGVILTGLDAGEYYWFFVLVENGATSTFSIARGATGQAAV